MGAQVRGDGDRGDVLEMMLARLVHGLPVGVEEANVQLGCEGAMKRGCSPRRWGGGRCPGGMGEDWKNRLDGQDSRWH